MREMKNSGIAWIGEIPADWNIIRGKAVLENLSRKIEPDMDVITCFRDGEVTLRKNRREEGFTFSDKEIGYQGIYPNDLVIHGMDGFAGAIGISDSKGKGSPILIVCDSNEDKDFLMYYLRNLAYRNIFVALSTGIRVRSCDLRWNKLSVLPFVIPSKEEQKLIVSKLKKKTKKIDGIIANQEAQIEKLKQYKQSLITEVVTKGLNPDAEMKDSGVEWIGSIPKHWSIIRIKHLYDYSNGSPVRVGPFGSALPNSEFIEDGIWVYNQRTVLDRNFKTNNTFISRKKAEELQGFEVFPKDILITTRGSIGKTAIVPTGSPKGVLHPCVIRFRINETKININLLTEIFNKTNICLGQILDMSNSTTIEVLYSYSLKEIWIPCPSAEEQEGILQKINEISCKFDKLIEIKQSKITKLNEFKKSLIYEYVTGKKEVQ